MYFGSRVQKVVYFPSDNSDVLSSHFSVQSEVHYFWTASARILVYKYCIFIRGPSLPALAPPFFFCFTLTPLCPPRFALEARPPLPLFYNSPMPHPCPPPQIFPPTGGGWAPGLFINGKRAYTMAGRLDTHTCFPCCLLDPPIPGSAVDRSLY